MTLAELTNLCLTSAPCFPPRRLISSSEVANDTAKRELNPRIEHIRQQLATRNGFENLRVEQAPAGRCQAEKEEMPTSVTGNGSRSFPGHFGRQIQDQWMEISGV